MREHHGGMYRVDTYFITKQLADLPLFVLMPVMFMFILNSYPAGLSFYYFVSNMVTFGQQALIKLFVDDDKIRAKME